jgi:hypothetical protein
MLVPPSLEEMKFTPPPSLKEPPKLFNYGLANLAAGTVAEDIVGIEIGGGAKGVLRQHVGNVFFLSYIFWFCIIKFFSKVQKF